MNMNKTTADTSSPALEETPQTTSSNKTKVIRYFDATSGYTLCYDKPTANSTSTSKSNNTKSSIATTKDSSSTSTTSTTATNKDTSVPSDTPPTVNHSDTSSLDVIMAYSTSTTITGDTSTFPSYLDDKEEVMEGEDMEEDTSEKKKVARYTDDITLV